MFSLQGLGAKTKSEERKQKSKMFPLQGLGAMCYSPSGARGKSFVTFAP